MSEIFIGELSKSNHSAVAVIMAGGSGTRFWPLSRTNRPKQFLPLGVGAESLIQATAVRVEPLTGPSGVMVVTASHQRKLVQEQLPKASVLSEPMARNTAACVGYAAVKVLSSIGDVPMICLPADHVVVGQDEILDVYRRAVEIATHQDLLVTIGIAPTAPETGYGYIERSEPFTSPGLNTCREDVYRVKRFVEKPNLQLAKEYLAGGNFFWNSGMFVWRPSVVLGAIEQFLPELFLGLTEIRSAFGKPDETELISEIYPKLPSVSIDIGIMEKAENVVMLSGESFTWSDVGSWSSWVDTVSKELADVHGNMVQGDVLLENCSNSSVVGGKKLIAAVGLKDLIIVDTPDAILVCHRDHSQEVKEVVQRLTKSGRTDLL